ncbi:MAG: amidohydrolase [Clostridiales bacterium]|nr:amidohydrolase [Clostridiales bacterium]
MRPKIFPRLLIFTLIAVLVCGFSGCARKEEPADLVLSNGQIVTMDESIPRAEALAVRGDRIVAVGDQKKIKRFIGESTKVIDLDGKLAIPGFIDSHGHYISLGQSKMALDLTKTNNWDEIVAMVKAAAEKAEPGEWILGRGWHQEKWDKMPEPQVDGLPFHTNLSQASPNNPVLLTHASGHSCLANAKAMELAGISKKTADPPGGQVVRDDKGTPIGAFRETAQGLLRRALNNYRAGLSAEQIMSEQRRAITLAAKECLAKGVTSFYDAGSSFETIDLFRELAEQAKLGVRLWVMISEGNENLAESLTRYKIIGAGQNHLTVRAIKRLIDGALGAHGAWLLAPYDDLPSSVGLNTTPIEAMKETARLAIENDFQLCTHAIGDRANRETLNIYEEAFRSHPDKKDVRWRIEHAQHLHPDDIPRFGSLGVIAAMQGIHCSSDGPWVIKRLGEKRAQEGAYVWRELMKTGAVISNGTDTPVEDVDPIACFHASVTRQMKDGSAFFPAQRMTREEALRSYTLNAAYSGFQENILGSLSAGKLADITVLSKNILTVPDEEILSAAVVYTIIGGSVRYQNIGGRQEYLFSFLEN